MGVVTLFRRLSRRWVGVLVVLVVLLTGAAGTTGAYLAVARGEQRYAGQVMDRYADEVARAVEDRVGRYGETLTDLAAAVGAQARLSSQQFTSMSVGLDGGRLTGATSVDFVVAADNGQIGAVQARWRAAGATGLTLRPAEGQPEHQFVIFEQTLDGVPNVPGIDLAQSPSASEALRTARITGALALSRGYQLLRDRTLPPGERQTSVALAAPVRSGLGSAAPDEFVGWTVMGVRGQDFLRDTLLDRGQNSVHVTLVDATGAGTVIAAVAPGTRVDDPVLTRQRNLVVGQRRWAITIDPTTRVLEAADRGMSRLTLAAGAALTVLLALLTGVLAGSRDRALEQVEQATGALRRDIARREAVEAELRKREDQLQHLAFHDPLTGLANRLLFYDRLTHALDTHSRNRQTLAVLYIDLDGFKQINDRLGHHAGDTVLQVTAERLRTGLRATDTVARFGGDEFAIVLEGLAAPADARTTAERIVGNVQRPIDLPDGPAALSASVGIATNIPGATIDDIIRAADSAMYQAKTGGKNRYAESTT